jgi:hypothetical protein
VNERDPDLQRRMGVPGYYLVDGRIAIAGPYPGWETAVREASRLNRQRLTGRPVEVRVIGPPAQLELGE